jgi:hypothetical protein
MASSWGTSWGNSWLNSWNRSVVVIPPTPEPVVLSGGPFAAEHRNVQWDPLRKSDIEKQQLELQLLREDGELIAVIMALC